jgi:hypothetical protein
MGANNKKLKIEFIRAEFKKEGYELLTEVYEGSKQKLEYICPRGHKHSVTWSDWKQRKRCPCFSNTTKLNIEFIRAEFAKEGYILLTEIYENSKQKLEYECPIGHIHSVLWGNWNTHNRRCPYCNGNAKLKIEFIRAEFKKEGYELLTKVYEGSHQKLEYICSGPEKHRHSITWGHWNSKNKRRCPYCAGNVKLSIEFIRAKFAEEGYTLLTKVYKNNKQRLEYICSRGHKHRVSWADWNSKRKCRCPFCKDSHVSKWEKTIRKFLDSLHVSYMPNDKSQLINPKTGYNLELDMWMPKLNKAIECNGLYWHEKKKQNDKIKKQLCKDQGIDLLVITDEEWNDDTDKCKNKIQEFLC